jgi:hypothetical protein
VAFFLQFAIWSKRVRAKLIAHIFHELIKKRKCLFSFLNLLQLGLGCHRQDEEQPSPESVGRAQVPRLVRYLPSGL